MATALALAVDLPPDFSPQKRVLRPTGSPPPRAASSCREPVLIRLSLVLLVPALKFFLTSFAVAANLSAMPLSLAPTAL